MDGVVVLRHPDPTAQAAAGGNGPKPAVIRSSTRWAAVAGWVLACAGLAATAWQLYAWRAFSIDDTFITLRYAAHLVHLGTLAWNPGGPPTQGFTSPLWTLFMALGVLAGVPGVALAKVGDVLAFAVALALATRILRRELRLPLPLALGPVAAALSLPIFAVHAASGMETLPFAASLLWLADRVLLWADAPGRRTGGFLVAAVLLSTFLRPEGALVTALLCLGLCRGDALRRLWWVAAVCVAAVVAYLLFSRLYFGLWLPLPWYVKHHGSVSGPHHARLYFRLTLVPLAAALLPAPPHRLRALALPALVLPFYYATTTPLMDYAMRYDVVFWPLLVCALVPTVAQVGRAGPIPRRAAAAVASVALLGWAPGVWHDQSSVARHTVSVYNDVIRTEHLPLGRALAPLGPHLRMAGGDAGVVPYASGAWDLDTVGLNSPEVAVHGLSVATLDRSDLNLLIAVRSGHSYIALDASDLLAAYAAARDYRCVGELAGAPAYALVVWAKGPYADAVANAVRPISAWSPCPVPPV